MTQSNNHLALLLWQGQQMIGLHNAFINELVHSCTESALRQQPLNLDVIIARINILQEQCVQVMDQETIPPHQGGES